MIESSGRTHTQRELLLRIEELNHRLREAEDTLDAIRSGEVDALVVHGREGEQVFTLQGAEKPYRAFLEQMHEGAVTFAQDGSILYANRFAGQLLGRPLEEIIGGQFDSLFEDEAIEEIRTEVGRSGTYKSVEARLVHRSTPVLLTISPLDGLEETYAATLTDLTEQKQRDELVASERLTSSILENATEAVIVCDQEGRVQKANTAATRLSRNYSSGAHFHASFSLRDPVGFDRLLDLAIKGNQVRGIVVEMDTPEGARALLLGAGPLASENGEGAIGCVVTLTDITERNNMVREMKELNENLERKVEERTEQLVGANRELEGFCYSVSHDLRAPLRSMMSSAMILMQDYGDQLDVEAHDQLSRLCRSSKRMGDLIDDLLTFSRLGRQEMLRRDIDLSSIANGVVDDCKRHWNGEHIQFEVEPNLQAKGDDVLLRMALENLVSNAIKFTKEKPDGKIQIGREGDAFFVRDNGIGFQQEYVDKIFKPFERLHSAADYPGTGIGLANVQRIITRHGGRVWAQGEPGKGATFYFTLG